MSTPVQANLQRQNSSGTFVPWNLDDTDPDLPAGIGASDPTIDYGVRAGIGTPGDATATSVTSGSVIAYLKAIWTAITAGVKVTNFPATQNVSGTVSVSDFPATQAVSAASLPLPAGAAADGTDGTGITAPTGAVGIRGWLSGIYAALKSTLSVSGTVAVSNLPATQPVSGTVTVDQSSGASLHADIDTLPPLVAGSAAIGTVGVTVLPSIPAGSALIGSVDVANLPTVQPVSGTVTVNQGTPPWPVTTPDLDNRFYSLLNQKIPDGHEMRSCLQSGTYYDPEGAGTTYTGADSASIYLGHAPSGSALTATVWDVIRLYFDTAGNPVLWRTVTGAAWLTDSATAGTINGGAISGLSGVWG